MEVNKSAAFAGNFACKRSIEPMHEQFRDSNRLQLPARGRDTR